MRVSLQGSVLYDSNYMIFWKWYTVDISRGQPLWRLRRKHDTVTAYYFVLNSNGDMLSCPYREQILVRTVDFR